MKKIKTHIFFVIILLITSCQKSIVRMKPEILTAQYEIKTHSEFERGYEIFIVINQVPENLHLKGIVFQNKLFKGIHFTSMSKNEIFIDQYFPVQSKMIQNFSTPQTDNRADGIIFEVDGNDYFYQVTFKLK